MLLPSAFTATAAQCVTNSSPPHPSPAPSLLQTAAFVLYVFSEWFSLEYVTTFVIVVLLLSADFWMVKNVSGRLLVGLRWWNRINAENGESEWIYESAPASHTVSTLDKNIFWGALYAAPLAWGACGVAAFLTLSWDWLLVHATATALTGANLLGYTRCSSEAKKRIESSMAAAGALHGALSIPGIASALPILGWLGGMGGAGGAPGGAGMAGGNGDFNGGRAGGGSVPRSVTDADAVSDPFGVGSNGGKVTI